MSKLTLYVIAIFLNQTCRPQAYACLVSWNCFGSHVGMCVCISAPEAINNQWCDIYRPFVIGLTSFTAFPCFQLLYMTPTVGKMDGHDLINTTCREHLPKKTKLMQYRQQKDYPKGRALQLKRWVGECIAAYLKQG